MKCIVTKTILTTITLFFMSNFLSVSAASAPTTLASTPTLSSSQVISVYNSSGTYTNAATLDISDNQQWGGLFTESSYTISGQSVICLTPTALSGTMGTFYHGANLSSSLNVASMKYLHVDMWVSSATSWTDMAIAPISSQSSSKNGQPLQSIFSSSTAGTWASFDISLSTIDSTDLVDLSQVNQFIVKNSGNSSISSLADNAIYLDNIYFWTDETSTDATAPVWDSSSPVIVSSTDETSVTLSLLATDNSNAVNYSISDGTNTYATSGTSGSSTSYTISDLTPSTTYNYTITLTDPTGNAASTTKTISVTTSDVISSATVPTASSSDVIALYSDAYTCISNSFENWYGTTTKVVPTGSATGSDKATKVTSTCCFGYAIASTDVSSYSSLHIDVYSVGTNTIYLGLVAPAGTECKLPLTLTSGQWNSIDLSLSDLLANNTSCDLTQVVQIGFWNLSGTFYIDNLYFNKNASSGVNQSVDTPSIQCSFDGNNQLSVSSGSTLSSVTVYGQTGQVVKSFSYDSNTATINLNGIASGCYIYKVVNVDGASVTGKIMKR